MKVCIVGAGNMGLVMAGAIATQNEHDVVVYTNKALSKNFRFEDVENRTIYKNLKIKSEKNLEKALEGADYVFCTYPAFLRKAFITQCEDYIVSGMKIGFIPGYGGAEYACKKMIAKGAVVFGLQRVPYIARQDNREFAHLLARKKELFVGSIPFDHVETICKDLEKLLTTPCKPVKEYLSVTLTPTNPLIHLSGVYIDFKDYKDGDAYDKQLMFYDEWTDETSDVLLKYDSELQNICNSIEGLDLHEVVSLRDYYESQTVHDMTKKLKSIEAFKVVKVPLINDGGKYYPDWNNRMFTEDFPFGIAVIKYFALLTKTETPTIDKILNFYKEKTGICYFNEDGSFGPNINESGIPALYGLDSLDKIIQFYKQ
ncbi:NAD/NADP octopine/nopaline dehydrogenase, alpha-helical domain protein [Eubacterium nodatum ATCC 33099]|nr:NAD/NADP octopine/nopaline dehydrogenase, alpha-helical domain protein [Eubacterium nodatum ATCC 33099]